MFKLLFSTNRINTIVKNDYYRKKNDGNDNIVINNDDDNNISGYKDRKNIYISKKVGAEMSMLVRSHTVQYSTRYIKLIFLYLCMYVFMLIFIFKFTLTFVFKNHVFDHMYDYVYFHIDIYAFMHT